jgi:hypothetical protein
VLGDQPVEPRLQAMDTSAIAMKTGAIASKAESDEWRRSRQRPRGRRS